MFEIGKEEPQELYFKTSHHHAKNYIQEDKKLQMRVSKIEYESSRLGYH